MSTDVQSPLPGRPLKEGEVVKEFVCIVAKNTIRKAAEQIARDFKSTEAFVHRSAMVPNNLNYGCVIRDINSELIVSDADPAKPAPRPGQPTEVPSDRDLCDVKVWGRITGTPAKLDEWMAALVRATSDDQENALPARQQIKRGPAKTDEG
jgi:hypothetical protein